MKNYKIASLGSEGRSEYKEILGLSGAEISLNVLPAGQAVPFVHHHKENEEIYVILGGSGELYIDGEEIAIKENDIFAITPEGKRAIRAVTELKYLCIQAKAGSLSLWTHSDGVLDSEKPSWLK